MRIPIFDIEVELILKSQNRSIDDRHKWTIIGMGKDDIDMELDKILSLEPKVESYHIVSIYHRGFADIITSGVRNMIGEQWVKEKIAESKLQQQEDLGNNKTSIDWI